MNNFLVKNGAKLRIFLYYRLKCNNFYMLNFRKRFMFQ